VAFCVPEKAVIVEHILWAPKGESKWNSQFWSNKLLLQWVKKKKRKKERKKTASVVMLYVQIEKQRWQVSLQAWFKDWKVSATF